MTRKKPASPGALSGRARADFLTLDTLRMQTLFICWREGARMPNSFHASEAEACALASARVQAGETMCVLRAEILTSFSAARTITETAAGANRRSAP